MKLYQNQSKNESISVLNLFLKIKNHYDLDFGHRMLKLKLYQDIVSICVKFKQNRSNNEGDKAMAKIFENWSIAPIIVLSTPSYRGRFKVVSVLRGCCLLYVDCCLLCAVP